VTSRSFAAWAFAAVLGLSGQRGEAAQSADWTIIYPTEKP
jgi:hypothetical protein